MEPDFGRSHHERISTEPFRGMRAGHQTCSSFEVATIAESEAFYTCF